MSTLVVDCPRCGARNSTADVLAAINRGIEANDWQYAHEAFCICRNCGRPTVFVLRLTNYNFRENFRSPDKLVAYNGSLTAHFETRGYISLKDESGVAPPEHLPDDVRTAFEEGATCLAVQCYNASAAMFRLAIDLATRTMLPPEGDGQRPNARTCRDLGLRIPWLFENGRLAEGLRDLAAAVREDGNEGAHAGTLTKEDAEDLLDFANALFERLYTEPKKLALAAERRLARRAPAVDK